MFLSKNKSILIGALLFIVIFLTRVNHFGGSTCFPDATLAAMLLGGLLVEETYWFLLAIILAFCLDAYAIRFENIPDYCMSFGYWGLIPTYGLVWSAGRYLKSFKQPFGFLAYFLTGLIATTIAFILSNAFWYSFSSKVNDLSVFQFSYDVTQYYLPYTGFTLLYLGIAYVIIRLFSIKPVSNNTPLKNIDG